MDGKTCLTCGLDKGHEGICQMCGRFGPLATVGYGHVNDCMCDRDEMCAECVEWRKGLQSLANSYRTSLHT